MLGMLLNVSGVSGLLARADVNTVEQEAGSVAFPFLLLNVTDEISGKKKAGIKWVGIIKRRGKKVRPIMVWDGSHTFEAQLILRVP